MCRLMQRYRWATEQKPNAGDQHRPPHSTATLQERMKMKVDWDELKRLQGEAKASVNRRGVSWTVMPSTQEMAEFYFHLSDAFPAILAEREAAQRLRDAIVALDVNKLYLLTKQIGDMVAAFDKETQNED